MGNEPTKTQPYELIRSLQSRVNAKNGQEIRTPKDPHNRPKSRPKERISAELAIFLCKYIMIRHGIPEDIENHIKRSFILPLFGLQVDVQYCNLHSCMVDFRKKEVRVIHNGWTCSFLGNLPNIPSFRIKINSVNSIAVGYASRKGFTPNGPTMFTKGMYLYTGNSLYSEQMEGVIRHESDYKNHKLSCFEEGSEVEVQLSLSKKTIRYIYQNVDFGVAYSNIDTTEDLYPAVSCYGPLKLTLL